MFFVHGLPWVSNYGPCHKKAVGYFNSPKASYFWWPLPGVDQAPSRRLPGKVRGTRRHNAPKNASDSDSAETYPKKNSSNFQSTVCWRSTFSRDSGFFHPSFFFFCIIFIRLHYEDTAEMVLILWKHLQKILNSNVVYYRWFNKTDAMHFLDDWKWTKKTSDHPLLFTWRSLPDFAVTFPKWPANSGSINAFDLTRIRAYPKIKDFQSFCWKKTVHNTKAAGVFPACHLNFFSRKGTTFDVGSRRNFQEFQAPGT